MSNGLKRGQAALNCGRGGPEARNNHLDELDVIECFTEPGKAAIQGEVLKKQEQIYRDLDVTPLLAKTER